MRVLLAPDDFGGTLPAAAAARALAEGWAQVAPGDVLDLAPLSDGGPGFLEVVRGALPGATAVPVVTEDPLGRPVPADVLVDGATAYVESAAAAGLHLLGPGERDPGRTSTRGVGTLLRAALQAGARRVVVGLGGSGTNDGGAGLLEGLGTRLTAADGAPLAPGGRALREAAALDGWPDLGAVELVAATDVTAPLLGPTGASAVFGPQKGATPADVTDLDAALARWADLLERAAGRRVRDQPGAGAAGGLGAALLALGARCEPGIAVVSALLRLPERVAAADLVVTGEGRFDATSLLGKASAGVAAQAAAQAVPCLVLAGQVHVGRREAAAAGIEAAYAVADLVGLDVALARPEEGLRALAARVAREWSRG